MAYRYQVYILCGVTKYKKWVFCYIINILDSMIYRIHDESFKILLYSYILLYFKLYVLTMRKPCPSDSGIDYISNIRYLLNILLVICK